MSLLQCALHPPYNLPLIALHLHQHLTLYHLTASVVTLFRVVIPVCFFSVLFHVISCCHHDLFRPVLSMYNEIVDVQVLEHMVDVSFFFLSLGAIAP